MLSTLNQLYNFSFCERRNTMVNKNNFDFMDQDCPKSVFLVQKRKNKHYYRILHNRISLGTSFIVIRQFFLFGPFLPKKGILFQ